MISIIIPTIGRTEHVLNCLSDLDRILAPNFEVLVVDQNEPSEQTYFRDGHTFALRHFYVAEPNASLARNIGLREARGESVLFLDDDVRITRADFLENHMRHYADTTIPGVYGQVLEVGQIPTDLPSTDDIESDWGWMFLPPNYSRRCRTRNGASNNLSVRRDWAIAVGGMDAWFQKGARREETEFNLRYTLRYGSLVFDPDATLVHLSASGGSRNWGHVRKYVPMHLIVGHWYFLLRVLCDRTLGGRGVLLELKYIAIALLKNPQSGGSIQIISVNLLRAFWGLCIACKRLVYGPRRMATLNTTLYKEIELG